MVLASGISGCSVAFLAANEAPPDVTNSCKIDADCGADATCTAGTCAAKSGIIDEVLLEVVPDANSPYGGLSYLSLQPGVLHGDRARLVPLPGRSSFVTQVLAQGSDLAASNCPYVSSGPQTIRARVEFTRTGAVGGVPVLGLTNVPLTIETALTPSGWNACVSLLPGTYDIYIDPVAAAGCQIAPRILRGIDIPQTDQSIPPATLELPSPGTLNGKVLRMPPANGTADSLEGWTVDIVEPQEGRRISTTAALGPTLPLSPMTNFVVTYQKLTATSAAAPSQGAPSGAGPLIRISPPAQMAESAPVIYWDLAAADLAGDGHCSLDMSGVPSATSLVEVTGQIQGTAGDGVMPVRATLQFSSIALDGAQGLIAAFNRSVTTDDQGRYDTQLFPGQYRVVVVPAATAANDFASTPTVDGHPAPTGAGARPWAILADQWSIGQAPVTLDAVLQRKRTATGYVFAGASQSPGAPGASLEAIPTVDASQLDTLKGVLARGPILPQNASVLVGNAGQIGLPLDPGNFDLSIRTPESSNFAWWVWPAAHVTLPAGGDDTLPLAPRIPFPVPLEGTITVPEIMAPSPPNQCTDEMGTPVALRGAAVRAYAKVPTGTGVTQVGDTRTDDMGHYRLRLPPSFGP
jgi:hypothetical protein